ncbi:MAG: methyltransferase family protein [Gaiellaceae bacterium]
MSQPLGAGWVAGQLVLIGLLVVAALVGPTWPSNPIALPLGIAFAAAATALFLAGAIGLGTALTPFPRPRGPLVEGGVFHLVRHPIYGGVLLGAIALALLTRPLVLVAAVAGLVFLTFKSRHEERLLLALHPEYEDYCRRVRRRFVPFLL